MEFTILAIKANDDFAYLKNLRPKVLYQFTNDHEFVGYREGWGTFKDITDIRDRASYPKEIYNVRLANKKILDVHVSAILGKNGAGKSSLLELLYLLIYCIGERKRFIKDRTFNQRQIDRGFTKEYFDEYKAEVNRLLNNAKIELYYKRKDEYYMITNTGEKIILYLLTNKGWKVATYKPELFFYSIAINYSLYGLNSNGGYFWLDPLFHKNDGYQTPIVLNPFRQQGVIDINTEIHLAQTRLLTNLTDRAFASANIIDSKEISYLTFDIIPEDVGKIGNYELSNIYQLTNDQKHIDLYDVFVALVKRYNLQFSVDFNPLRTDFRKDLEIRRKTTEELYNAKYHQDEDVGYRTITRLLVKYIIAKIVKICIRYDEYNEYTDIYSNPEAKIAPVKLINVLDRLVTKLLSDDSHITLKLKQALNAFIHSYFSVKNWRKVRNPQRVENFLYRCNVSIEELRTMVNKAYENSDIKKKRITHFIPTGCFKPAINLTYPGGSSEFHQLSSGEQQMIHSIHSIIYHILNLETLDRKEISYTCVNLILDEIELYYHPGYQRVFIKKLLENLSKLHLTQIRGLNIMFSTHSPFILSDIPHHNVMKMIGGMPAPFDIEEKTFGSNIHEMLTDSFFLDYELIGAFAKEKIELCIKNLNELKNLKSLSEKPAVSEVSSKEITVPENIVEPKNKQSRLTAFEKARQTEIMSLAIFKTINMIGEPVIRIKLMEMYDDLALTSIDEKEKAKRQIQQLMDIHNIDKNEI